jgi:membrane associated rhomboid family serine protease
VKGNDDMTHTIQQGVHAIIAFVAVMWGAFFVSFILPFDTKALLGLTPRTLAGLAGIPASPFVHANLSHLVANTVPLFVLLILLVGSNSRPWAIVIAVILLSGTLLWLFGRNAVHVGASGLIFGLVGFLVAYGFLEKRGVPLIVSVIVGFLYGGTLLSGIVPRIGSQMSWDGHLTGAVAGGLVAYLATRG